MGAAILLAAGGSEYDDRADKFFNVTAGRFAGSGSAVGYSVTSGFGAFVGGNKYGPSYILSVYSAVAATTGSGLTVTVTGNRAQNWFKSIEVIEGSNPRLFETASADAYSYDAGTGTTTWSWNGARAWTDSDLGLNRDCFLDMS